MKTPKLEVGKKYRHPNGKGLVYEILAIHNNNSVLGDMVWFTYDLNGKPDYSTCGIKGFEGFVEYKEPLKPVKFSYWFIVKQRDDNKKGEPYIPNIMDYYLTKADALEEMDPEDYDVGVVELKGEFIPNASNHSQG